MSHLLVHHPYFHIIEEKKKLDLKLDKPVAKSNYMA
jgi:hypothetical protein